MEKITPEWIAEQRKVCAKANEQIFSHEKVRAENAIVYELFAAALDTLEAALAENDRLKTPRQKKQNYCTAPMDYRAGARCASIAASGICNYPRETCQYQNERGDNELISEIARLTAERDAAVKCIRDTETYIQLGSRRYAQQTITDWRSLCAENAPEGSKDATLE